MSVSEIEKDLKRIKDALTKLSKEKKVAEDKLGKSFQ